MNWLTIKEVCERLQLSQRTILFYIKERNMPCYKMGKAWRFDEKEVDEWIKKEFGS